MGKKKKEAKLNCVAYLSTDGDINGVERREKKQLKYIAEYAKAHNIKLKNIYHRDVAGMTDVNKHFLMMLQLIKRGEIDGIIVSRMMTVSNDIPDAYKKVGMVYEAGGTMVTVDEGRLGFMIKVGENNERD